MAASTSASNLSKDDKKDLALLVATGRISARRAERVVGLRGDGTSLLYYVRTVWGPLDLTSVGVQDLVAQYEKKFAARFPNLFDGAVQEPGQAGPLAVPLAAPGGPIVPDGLDKSKPSKIKRAAQISAIEYHNRMNKGATSMTWKKACKTTRQAFRGKSYAINTLNPKKTSLLERTMKSAAGAPPRLPGGKTLIPAVLEEDLAFVVGHIRSKRFPVYKAQIKSHMDKSLEALGSFNPFPNGVTEKWYQGWKKRYNMDSGNETALDRRRARWMISSNLFQAYHNLFDAAVEYGCAVRNNAFVSEEETPHEHPIRWKPTELWRMMEFDECGQDLGVKTDSATKTKTEQVVSPKGSATPVLREGVPAHHISAMCGINFAGENLLSGFVFSLGRNAHLKPEYLTDDNGELLEIPLGDGEGGLHPVPAFVSSNEKGSFDCEMLIAYMTQLIDHLQRLHKKNFTKEKPGILFIDGCQTHITGQVIRWCVANHIQLVIKLPYGTSKMQSMDARGGHFQMIQPRYRTSLRIRSMQLIIAYRNAVEEGRFPLTGMAAQKGSLMMSDFFPCIKQPWLEYCTEEENKKNLRTVGVVPPTMQPAYDKLNKEKAEAIRAERQSRLRALEEAQLLPASRAMRKSVIDLLSPVGRKRKRDEDIDSHGNVVTAGGAAAGAGTATAVGGAGAAAGGEAAQNTRHTTAESAGNDAARRVVRSYQGVGQSEKNKVYAMVKKNGNKWIKIRSGGLWANFNGVATSRAHLMYDAAIQARANAIARFQRRKRAKATETLQRKMAAQVPVANAAHAKMVAAEWSSDYANSREMNCAALVALARVHGGLQDKVAVSGSGKSKKDILVLLEPYFRHMRSQLPRQRRTNAGCPGQRLGEV